MRKSLIVPLDSGGMEHMPVNLLVASPETADGAGENGVASNFFENPKNQTHENQNHPHSWRCFGDGLVADVLRDQSARGIQHTPLDAASSKRPSV